MAFLTTGASGGNGLSSEINVTPLIDVLLVMLIIFMVIVPEMPRGLTSVLPSADTGVADVIVNRPVFVEVEPGLTTVRYVVDGADVEQEELALRLARLLSQTSARRVLLKADARLDFGVVARVINAAEAGGAESVGLVTPQSEGLSQ